MLLEGLLLGLPGLYLDGLRLEAETVVIAVHTTARKARCPACNQLSDQVHSRYVRHPQDLPWAAHPVRWDLQVRRFRCLTASCPRQLFSERLAEVLPPYARRTQRLATALCQVGLALGGAAGARLGAQLGLVASPSTLLRLLRRAPVPSRRTPRVVGIDEWAWRKGRQYGTIVVDLEAHHVVELLPDCSSESVAQWLQAHPGIEVISRDRSGPFANAATQGAPEAIQVADRWHLLQNIGEVLQRVFERQRAVLDPIRVRVDPQAAEVASATGAETGRAEDSVGALAAEPASRAAHPLPPAHHDTPDALPSERQAQRQARYDEVHRLHALGLNHSEIARQVGLARQTVARWLKADALPERQGAKGRGRPLGSKLDPYKPYLVERFQAGCHNACKLYEEIQQQGYPGSRSLVRKFITGLRQANGQLPRTASPRQQRYSLPDLVFCVLRRPEERSAEQQRVVEQLAAAEAPVSTAYHLTQTFATMVREQRAEAFEEWLTQATESGIPEFRTFVTGVRRDEAAVRAALSLPWSNGQTEGQIHRLKLIKRSMYGRANFALLRQRVLLAA